MFIYFGVFFVILILTRVLAYWASAVLAGGDIPLIPDVLYFSYVKNQGAAFGIFQGATAFLIGVSVAFFILLTAYVIKRRNELLPSAVIALSMVAGGGMANVADRLQYGFVVDYIDVRLISYPVFNLADICVVLGILWFVWQILFGKESKKR